MEVQEGSRLPDVDSTDRGSADSTDRGSVTPLVLGMVLCLLLLGAGVIAAGSAVLARRNLQSVCDGATTYAAGSLTPEDAAYGNTSDVGQLVTSYLSQRTSATAQYGLTADALNTRCEIDAPVTFGALFLNPTVHLGVNSTSRIDRTVG